MKKFSVFLICLSLIFPAVVLARVGVGIGTGRITLDEPLKSGGIYNLPSLTILNTGDEPCQYEAGIAYHKDQPQLKPAEEWFQFDPPSFHLEPGGAQVVAVQLILPLETKPGDYFAYLEGRSAKETKPGVVSIGVAAAAKLYFTIAPANIWQAIYYRLSDLWKIYSPWPTIVLVLIIGAVLVILFRTIFRKFFKLRIGISKK